MPFPAGLQLVTVTCQFDTLPGGGSSGSVRIFYDGPLTGATDNSIVPYVDESESLDASGACDIEVPATNDPGWVPADFAYTVVVNLGTHTRRGTLQLDYQTTTVNLADFIQWDGAAVAGTTYATLAQLTTHEADTTGVHGIADTSALATSGSVTAAVAAHAAAIDPHGDRAYAAALVDDLSGVTNASAARTALGLGTSATRDVGTSTGTVAAGDDARITGALQTTGGTVTGDLVVDGAVARVDGAAGTFRQIQWSTADSVRWSAHTNNTAESGGNAGSDWRLVRYDDAGEALDAPIGVARSTGAVALGGPLTVAGVDFRLANTAVKATDHSLTGWTFDPATGVQGGTVMPTSGLAHVARVQALGGTVTNIVFDATAGGSGLTGFYAAVYNDAGALIGAAAVTGDAASAMGSSGLKTLPLTVAQGLTVFAYYRILFWFTGTTGPTLSRGLSSASGLVTVGQSSGYRFSTADTGLVATPPSNIGTQTAGTTAWWVGLS